MSEPGQVTSLVSHLNRETVSETNYPLSNLPSKAHQPRKNLIFQRRVLDSLQKVCHYSSTNGIGCITRKMTTS